MNGYQFIAAIFQSIISLAWPAAFVAVAWIFKDKIAELLPLLRFKYKDLDISFRLDEAEREAQALPPQEAPEPTPEEADKFVHLLRISPRAAIIDRRLELEDALLQFARSVGMEVRNPSLLQVTRQLRKHDLIDQTTSALLDDLRAIGNAAAHDAAFDISANDAERFRALADKLIQQLRNSAAAAEELRRPAPVVLNP